MGPDASNTQLGRPSRVCRHISTHCGEIMRNTSYLGCTDGRKFGDALFEVKWQLRSEANDT
jgi:hypothetical protein